MGGLTSLHHNHTQPNMGLRIWLCTRVLITEPTIMGIHSWAARLVTSLAIQPALPIVGGSNRINYSRSITSYNTTSEREGPESFLKLPNSVNIGLISFCRVCDQWGIVQRLHLAMIALGEGGQPPLKPSSHRHIPVFTDRCHSTRLSLKRGDPQPSPLSLKIPSCLHHEAT